MSDASIFDHLSLRVSNYERSKNFYIAALKPLGITMMMEFPGADGSSAGFGRGMPTLWIDDSEKAPQRGHVAFSAATRAMVDAFYQAALAAGASDNGAPGLRPHYHAHYYAAFVRDPDGHNIEAVTHADPNAKPARARAGSARGKSARGKAAKGRAKVRPATKKAKTNGKAKAPAGRRSTGRKPARRAGAKRSRR
jgi:catechol 2,3-dioxygenase-like lactoylglutathione lyase family enzyme